MRKYKLVLMVITVAIVAMMISGCSGIAGIKYDGTWYTTDSCNRVSTMTLNTDGSVNFSQGGTGHWKEIDGGIAIETMLESVTLLDQEDGSLLMVGSNEKYRTFYYKSEEAAHDYNMQVTEESFTAYELAEASFREELEQRLVGEWEYEQILDSGDTRNPYVTLTINADGTYTCKGSNYTTDYSIGAWQSGGSGIVYTWYDYEHSGTWEIVTKSADETYDGNALFEFVADPSPVRFDGKIELACLKDFEGRNYFSSNGVSISWMRPDEGYVVNGFTKVE